MKTVTFHEKNALKHRGVNTGHWQLAERARIISKILSAPATDLNWCKDCKDCVEIKVKGWIT